MIIFFENRIIELLDPLTSQVTQTARTVEFTTGKEFIQVLNDFLENQGPENLFIWSKKDAENWKKQFFKLFKRVDAAGGIVRNENQDILFIFRLGKWDLPKGKLKKGESPEEGALREVIEETGLRHVKILRRMPDTFHIYQLNGKTILKRTFWFEMFSDGNQPLSPQSEEDISKVEWIGVEELSKVSENTYASLKDLIKLYLR